MDPVREYADSEANDDVRATLLWLDANGYRVTASARSGSLGDVSLTFENRREVVITRDRGQWWIDLSLTPGGDRLWLDVLDSAQAGREWAPPPLEREFVDRPMAEQLPAGITWSSSLPVVLGWLDQPGGEAAAHAATMRARELMRRRWRELERP